jgi:hypothetical protein
MKNQEGESMKKIKEQKPLPRTCQTCEFDSKEMCTIHGEGYKSRETSNTCNDWSISLTAFEKQDKRNRR